MVETKPSDTQLPRSEAPQSDLDAHATGYAKFITVFKWGALAAFIIAAIVVYLIA